MWRAFPLDVFSDSMSRSAQQLDHGVEKTAVVVNQTLTRFLIDRLCRDPFGFGLLAAAWTVLAFKFEAAIFLQVIICLALG